MDLQEQVEQYRDQGFFIVDDGVEPQMLAELTAASERAVAKVRSGVVVDSEDGVSMGGEEADPPFVTGLMAPEFGELVFAQYLGSEPVARYVQPFIGDQLRLGWVHLCAVRGPYDSGWHRDTGGNNRDGTYEEEMEILGRHRKNFIKWHLALVDDPCLWIVPGSQRRYRTDDEREVLINNRSGDIAAGQLIDLRRGQTIFWDSNSIHRGYKPEGMGDRLTLMGALIDHRTAYDGAGEKGDFRWLLAENIRPSLPEQTRRYYDNWRQLAGPRLGVE